VINLEIKKNETTALNFKSKIVTNCFTNSNLITLSKTSLKNFAHDFAVDAKKKYLGLLE